MSATLLDIGVRQDYDFGDRVTFTWSLTRRRHYDETRRLYVNTWETAGYPGQPEPAPRVGIVVGVRTLADGDVQFNYEEPAEFTPTRHFRAYLIAFDLHRKPVLVLPEHMRVVGL